MNYKKLYENLLKKHGSEVKPEYYAERHHIIPRSLGGSDESSNLTYLSPKAHFVSHLLLWKIHRCPATARAYFMMACTGESYDRSLRVTSAQFEKARLAYSEHASEFAKSQWATDYDKMRDSVMFMFNDESHPMYMKGKTGFDHPRGKPVKTPLGEFGSVREAGRAHGIAHNIISRYCKSNKHSEFYYIDG